MKGQSALEITRAHFDTWKTEFRADSFDGIDPEIRLRAERVLRLIGERADPHQEILEVGCGTGWLAERLRELGPVTGIDLSPRAIEIAKQRGIDVEFVADDFLTHDFAPASFDIVVCVETLFYVYDQDSTVRRIAELLGPGGWHCSRASTNSCTTGAETSSRRLLVDLASGSPVVNCAGSSLGISKSSEAKRCGPKATPVYCVS